MRTKRYCGLFIMTVLMAVASGCKKDKEEPIPTPPENTGGDNPTNGTMSATIIESSYSADNATARFRTNGQLTIMSTDNEERTFFFVINNFSGPVTYSFGTGLQNSASYQYDLSGQNIEFSTVGMGSGSMQITDYNESEQLISGTFSFIATQVGSPENSIEITEGEFNEVPITSLQMPDAGEAVFYYNDQFYHADSVKATLKPPFLMEISLYQESIGWVKSIWIHTYPDYVQNTNGFATGFWAGSLSAGFNNEYYPESESISLSMKLETHTTAVYDFEYAINQIHVSDPYNTEPNTVTLWSSDLETEMINYTTATLSPDENGNYELSAENDAGQSLVVVNISPTPNSGFLPVHTAGAIVYGPSLLSNYGYCYWQPSELGSGFYSLEFTVSLTSSELIIVARDIPIEE